MAEHSQVVSVSVSWFGIYSVCCIATYARTRGRGLPATRAHSPCLLASSSAALRVPGPLATDRRSSAAFASPERETKEHRAHFPLVLAGLHCFLGRPKCSLVLCGLNKDMIVTMGWKLYGLLECARHESYCIHIHSSPLTVAFKMRGR
jgi:hypothetical protein